MDGCSFEQIKAHCKGSERQVEKVLTPGWGEPGFVHVRTLKMGENDLVTRLIPKGDLSEAEKARANMAAWCVACVCDEKGERKFPDEAVEVLMDPEAPLPPIYACSNAALDINGITKDLVKNSEKTRSDNSK